MRKKIEIIIAIILIVPAYIVDRIESIKYKLYTKKLYYNDQPIAKGHNI